MKKFVSMALALTVAASMAVPAFAASEPVAPQNEPTAATESVSLSPLVSIGRALQNSTPLIM